MSGLHTMASIGRSICRRSTEDEFAKNIRVIAVDSSFTAVDQKRQLCKGIDSNGNGGPGQWENKDVISTKK